MPKPSNAPCSRTLAIALSLACASGSALAQSSSTDSEGFYVRGQLTYDDNLFRLPSDASVDGEQGSAVVATEDYVSKAALGLAETVDIGRQTFRVNLHAEDVRFDRNDHLDHTAGRARLAWDWLLLGPWSGRIAAEYTRTLADFANMRSLGTDEPIKDMLETVDYSADARYRLGPRWAVFAGARRMQTEHNAELRRFDDFEADSGRFGVEYATPSEHRIGLEYRYTDAKFPQLAALESTGRRSGYEESTALGRVSYVASIRTRIDAAVGYTKRRHPDGSAGEYSGNTWRAEIEWEPRVKFATTLAAWHEIKAYSDAESDYFVADGFSIEPSWSPLRSLTLSLALSWEELDYLGSNPLLEDQASRADEVRAAQVKLLYAPRTHLRFDLSWRGVERDSNRPRSQYDANSAMAAIQWRFL